MMAGWMTIWPNGFGSAFRLSNASIPAAMYNAVLRPALANRLSWG
jgi:hypothetical protein